jgi:hypothetical protein
MSAAISTLIGWAERAPAPDLLVKAGIGALVGRTARKLVDVGEADEAAFAAFPSRPMSATPTPNIMKCLRRSSTSFLAPAENTRAACSRMRA